MKTNEADLHIHSHYSDGDCSVDELVKRMKKSGLKVAVLTDHDTTDGAERFIKLCAQHGIDTISGIEISSTHCYFTDAKELWKLELHILGYGYNLKSLSSGNELLYRNQVVSNHHVETMIMKYKIYDEFSTSFVELTNQFNVPWPLTSKYWLIKARAINLMETKNLDFNEAKILATREISRGGRFYARRGDYCSPREAIELIKLHSGMAVWAHSLKYLHQLEKFFPLEANVIFEKTLKELKGFGLDGLEVFTQHHSQKDREFLLKYCEKYNLNPNFGGSDYHGDKENEYMLGIYLGKGGISHNQFLELKKILKKK